MKVRALRVAETGPFREGIAIEGLSGGLDVLAGPNELGKSTLLRALHALLLESHKTTKGEVRDLVPYSGGAPLIEADLEIGGRSWRLRKRFLQQRSAELSELGTGRLLRGSDAEQRMAELLGEAVPALSLLWVGQGQGLLPRAPNAAETLPLRAALAREVTALASGRRAQAVLDLVSGEMAKLLTPTGKPLTGGPLKQAIDDCARLEAELAAARAALGEAEARLDRLAIARLREQELNDPFVARRIADEAAAARKAAEERREAEAKLRLARSEWHRAEAALTSAAEVAARRERLAAEIGQFRQDVPGAELDHARSAAEAADLAAKEAQDRHAALQEEEKRLRSRERRDALARRLSDATTLAAEARQLAERIRKTAVTDVLVRRIVAEEREVLRLEAGLAASATQLRFEIEKAGRERVRIAGRPVRDGEALTASAPLTIEIAGVGRIHLTPGAHAERDGDAADLAAHRSVLDELLEKAGAATASEAAGLLDARRESEARLREIEARRAALLPEGEETAAALLARLATEAGALPPADAEHAIGRQLAAIERDRAQAEAAAREAASRSTDARVRLSGLASTAAERERRRQALDAELAAAPPAEELAARLDSLTRSAHEARRSLDAWREKELTPEAATAHERLLELALAAEARHKEECERNNLELAELKGALARDQEADLPFRVETLEGELKRAIARRERHQRAADELLLIRTAFAAVRAGSRALAVAPVLAAIEPYLGLVLPGASLELGTDYAVGGLMRGGAPEEVRHLSDGTREQIAVLARLGFARLLAESGKPCPLILDDALVYADDERIARAFEALQLASRLHQVIVLTCRTRTFEALGGRRVKVGKWTG